MSEFTSVDDEEILKFIETSKPKIYIVGTGGSGSNTINRLYDLGVEGATLIAMNTDAPHLIRTRAERKLLLGKKVTKGLGAGSDLNVGEEAASESKEEIKHMLGDANMVFVTCGLGGGTGTGSVATIASEARDIGALTVAIVTLPFSSEGKTRMKNALEGLSRLKKAADTVIIIHNDKLLDLVPDLPLNMAFKASDEILANAAKGIVEMITKPGMVNIDFADLKMVLKSSGYAVISSGESEQTNTNGKNNRALMALENAIKSPLLNVDLGTAKKALINIIGGESLTLREAESIFQEVSSRINNDALIKWGARIDKEMKKESLKVMVVISGVEFDQYSDSNIDKTVSELNDLDLDKVFETKKKKPINLT
jgi:cell division protein FtsZ